VTLSGNTLTLKFTEALDVDHTNAASVIGTELSDSKYGSGSTATSSWANDDKDLVVALGSDHTISVGSTMNFDGLYDLAGNLGVALDFTA
jgi:hypothetical protein